LDPILTIDIGAGTTDLLVYFPDTAEHYKAVGVSPVKWIADFVGKEGGDLLITGTLMGGGAVSKALINHARTHRVYMTTEAAGTIHPDLGEVRRRGITVISEGEVPPIAGVTTQLTIGDVCPETIRSLLECLKIGWRFSYVGGAVQDHGACPEGIDPLDFRHQTFKTLLERDPCPEEFLFSWDEIPAPLSRMKATGKRLCELPQQEVFMIDTGVAAILGASLDPRIRECRHSIVVDVGNSHTLGAVVSSGHIGGFFEYHTDSLAPRRLGELLVHLGDGKLDHREVVSQGGHGAYIGSCPGFHRIEKIVITGPRRGPFLRELESEVIEGAPLGDNMMTGTAGILEAINRKRGLGILL
jgi:uncharacterized protein (DUF1786 family)